MVKTTTPEMIPRGNGPGKNLGQSFNHTCSLSKSSQYLFYNTLTDYYNLSSSYNQHSYAHFRYTDAQLIGFEVGKRRLGTARRVIVVGLSHGKQLMHYHMAVSSSKTKTSCDAL